MGTFEWRCFAGYLTTFSHCVIVANRPRARMRQSEVPDTKLGSFANMEVAKAGRSPESLCFRAVGMVQAGITQSEVAAKIGASRKTVNKWWKRF